MVIGRVPEIRPIYFSLGHLETYIGYVFITSKSENGIDTVSECTLQLINDAENYFDEDRDIQNIKVERGRNREMHVNHFEQSR